MAAKNAIVKAAFELQSSHVCEKRSKRLGVIHHNTRVIKQNFCSGVRSAGRVNSDGGQM